MKCCANCFSDRVLANERIPTFSDTNGNCDFCDTENIGLVEPDCLRDDFESLISIYTQDNEGKTLVEWFKSDWGMFTHEKMDNANSSMLLAEILDDGDIVRKRFSPSELCKSDTLDLWSEFKRELMYENRFFPKKKMDNDLLTKRLTYLVVDPNDVSGAWCRARIQRGSSSFTKEEMGAPPKEITSHGRANPAGIPYLYLASNADTAVSEIRPHTGESACVANFTITNTLEIIDLRNPRKTLSPFIHSEEKKIAGLRGDIEYLVQLGKELSRPILPHVAIIDYLPSQYFCEFIKSCGYHGVIYSSSVGEGINIAIFKPDMAQAGDIKQYRVSKVSVQLEE